MPDFRGVGAAGTDVYVASGYVQQKSRAMQTTIHTLIHPASARIDMSVPQTDRESPSLTHVVNTLS